MRLLICAGGTGGGVYPALAVQQALGARLVSSDILWVGGQGGMETALVARAGVPFRTIPAAGVHGVDLRALPGNLVRLMRGFLAARRILREFKPDVLFFTGGYVAVPVALAGWMIPSLLYVPDIEPGLALKALAGFAHRIAVTTPDSRRFFSRPKRVTVTGYPTRSELLSWTRDTGREKLGLQADMPVLLVFGGSKGARSLNTALLGGLTRLLEKTQVVHISGELDWPAVEATRASLPLEMAGRYHAFAYLHEEMGAALAAADLVISRAGASILGEFPLFGLPAVLVPYPYAWRYQKTNAAYLARCGGALVLDDASLETDMVSTALSLLGSTTRLEAMHIAMQSISSPQAASRIAEELMEMAGKV